jgi:hypothetical protein
MQVLKWNEHNKIRFSFVNNRKAFVYFFIYSIVTNKYQKYLNFMLRKKQKNNETFLKNANLFI